MSTCRSSGGRSFQILGPATEKSLSPKLFCVSGTTHVLYSWLIEGDAVRCQREAGHHRPSTGEPDHILTCTWYRPVWTALVDVWNGTRSYRGHLLLYARSTIPVVDDLVWFDFSHSSETVYGAIMWCRCPASAHSCIFRQRVRTEPSSQIAFCVWDCQNVRV